MWFLRNAWLIPVLPGAAFFLALFFGKRLPKGGSELTITAALASLVLAFITAGQWISRVQDAGGQGALAVFGRSFLPSATEKLPAVQPVIHTWTWWQSGGVKFTIGSHIDGLSVAVLLVVTIVSTLVQIYSLEYMRGDRRFTHFFAAISLFTAGMLTLVIAENTLQLLLGWEITSVCSFMLIGHWWEEGANSRAALKAFFTTRTGDVGLLIGISIMYFGAGSFSIEKINEAALSGQISHLVLLMGAISLFAAVIGKSGQFPLHTWLPDAMAGPTPVSALIHAATMVVAGVYLAARLYPVFYQGFSIAHGGINLMATIGGITIIIAALLAFVQNDIKKVLAYSTVSQLGYMVMGLGVGAWSATVFHLFTNAFFKALLFLGAGSVSHSGSHHSFDMKKDMGGLRKYMPVTFVTFLIGTAALAGIFPLAGFWSKDEILANAGANSYTAFMIVGFVGAFLTAAYMTRCVYLTFFGEYRGGHDTPHDELRAEREEEPALAVVGGSHAGPGHDVDVHVAHDTGHGAHAGPHESPRLITVPLVILAVLSVVAGWLQFEPGFHLEKFKEWVEPRVGFPELQHAAFSYGKAGLSVGLALVAGFIVARLYATDFAFFRGLTERSRLAHAGYAFLVNKYYLDDLYEKVVVGAISGPLARGANWINQTVIDGIVNGVGIGARESGKFVYEKVDQMVVDGAVNGTGLTAEGSGSLLRGLQSGKVQQYGALLFGAAAIGGLILVIVI